MKEKNERLLSPALVLLLQSCIELKTTQDKKLAERLCLSPETIRTEFKRIATILHTHDRIEAGMKACENGWISLPLTPPTDYNPSELCDL